MLVRWLCVFVLLSGLVLGGPGPGPDQTWGRAVGGGEIKGTTHPARPRRSTKERPGLVVRAEKVDDAVQTTTFVTVTTSSVRKAVGSSPSAKVARLAVLAAVATESDPSTSASTTTKKSKGDAKGTTSTSHKVLNQVVTSIATATTPSAATSSATSSSSSSASAVPSNYKIPRAFDSTLGTNFTSTACPSFFATFLADPDFIACAPFSLLLATSSAFFKAQQSPDVLLPYVMNATCGANQTTCSGVMDNYAALIKSPATCGPDLTKRNPLVVQALSGFQNYKMMYQAGCSQNNQTGEVSATICGVGSVAVGADRSLSHAQYCFAQAAAASTASELYFWYLPEGTGLPSGTQTSCDSCTGDLMQIYANYAYVQPPPPPPLPRSSALRLTPTPLPLA